MLMAQLNGMRVDARQAVRGDPHICPACRDPVVLHRGMIIAAHFKHKAEKICDWARGETSAHLGAKDLMRAEFERRGVRVETEFIVDTMPGDRRADVMVWTPGGSMVAFELQHASIDPRHIAERVASYARVGIRQCWIPFLPDVVWDKGHKTEAGWTMSGYTPKPFEVWLHRMHGSARTWMFDRREGSFWLAALQPHKLFKDYRVYYDESGEERSSGGYPYEAARKRDLVLSGPYPLSDLLVDRLDIRSGRWKKVPWPKMRIACLRVGQSSDA